MSKHLTVLRGLPGSGKTHILASLSYLYCVYGDEAAVICSADHFFMRDGEYGFDPSLLPIAHKTCFLKFVEAVDAGKQHIIIDNTNINAAEFAPYMTYAQAFDYETELVTVWVPLEVAMKRQTHGVPDQVMFKMYTDLINAQVPPWYNQRIIHN